MQMRGEATAFWVSVNPLRTNGYKRPQSWFDESRIVDTVALVELPLRTRDVEVEFIRKGDYTGKSVKG